MDIVLKAKEPYFLRYPLCKPQNRYNYEVARGSGAVKEVIQATSWKESNLQNSNTFMTRKGYHAIAPYKTITSINSLYPNLLKVIDFSKRRFYKHITLIL
jgi:hypothetical protein